MARAAPAPLDAGLLVPKGLSRVETPTEETPPVPEARAPRPHAETHQQVSARRSALAPKAKPVRVPITVKIKPETLRRLRVVAVHLEVEQQDIVEEALSHWLDDNGAT